MTRDPEGYLFQQSRPDWKKLVQPARKLAQMASMRLRIFITMNLSCVGILFFFQCGGCDAVLQLRHQSTIGRPLQHHQVFSISYFPLFINLFHCVCLISVHVCLLVDLQTEVVLGVTWSLTRTCFELLRTLASKCHLVSDSMLGMNFQG